MVNDGLTPTGPWTVQACLSTKLSALSGSDRPVMEGPINEAHRDAMPAHESDFERAADHAVIRAPVGQAGRLLQHL